MAINILQMGSASQKALGRGQITSATANVIYTVPASTVAIVKQFLLSNMNSNAPVGVWVVPAGQTAGVPNYVIRNYTLNQNDVLNLTDYFTEMRLEAGDTICVGSTSGAINYVLSGYELS